MTPAHASTQAARSALRPARGLLALLLAACAGCDACAEPKPARIAPIAPIATLTQIQGRGVLRDVAAQVGAWRAADIGATFALGDGVRTEQPSSAVLLLADGSTLQVRPGTTLRFLADAGPAERAIDVQTGEALLRAGAHDVQLRTHVGLAILAAGSQVVLGRDGDAMNYRVEVGEARLRGADGKYDVLRKGDDVDVAIGMARLRTPAAAAEPDAGAAADPIAMVIGADDPALLEPVREEAPAGRDTVAEVGPDFANLGVRAGETLVVHAPEVPVAVGIGFEGKCAGEGVVELAQGKQRSRGRQRANLMFPPGMRGYTLRCLDARGAPGKVVARGSVQVMHDAGTRKLPLRAPTSSVDADGRAYTIYYQNQLPEIVVRWPNAPAAASYKVEVDGVAMSVPRAEHRFRSGSLRDGGHKLTFGANERRSRTTQIEVRFDNAAPKVSLSAPADRGFAAGDRVTIEGVALPGWKVSVEGGTIDADRENRFVGQVVTSAARPDIAVRLTHPRLGTHYYLRRASGSR